MQALIFDVDGTLADTESAHLHAFNAAFAEAGLDWHWDETLYARLLAVAGGKERLLHYWRIADPQEAEGSGVTGVIDTVHAIKTRHYAERVRNGGLPLRPGIARLIDEAAEASIPVAIATTTTPANLDALLQGLSAPNGAAVSLRSATRAPRRPRSLRPMSTSTCFGNSACKARIAWRSRTPPTVCGRRARRSYPLS